MDVIFAVEPLTCNITDAMSESVHVDVNGE